MYFHRVLHSKDSCFSKIIRIFAEKLLMEETEIKKSGKKERLEWLDAMRGFTMILVVAFHVSQMGFGLPVKTSSSLPFLLLFRMPLFFFISGFLAYKAGLNWTWPVFCQMMGKKLRIQLIPTVVFFLLGAAVITPNFLTTVEKWIHIPTKGGYWFTIALLWMFIAYYVFAYLESKLKVRSWIPITVLFIISLLIYESCYMPKYFSWAAGYKGVHNAFLDDTSRVQAMMYFPFFIYDGFPLVLSRHRRHCHLCDHGCVKVAYPALGLDEPAVNDGQIWFVDDCVHVFPPLCKILHQVYNRWGFPAIYRSAHIGHLPDTLFIYAKPSNRWKFLWHLSSQFHTRHDVFRGDSDTRYLFLLHHVEYSAGQSVL